MDETGIAVQVLSISGATFGIDQILFSVVYPYSTNEQERAFLDGINLPPKYLNKIAHGNHSNADRLLKLRT